MNRKFIYKFLAVLKQKKILGNKCFSEQIFYRKCRSVPLNYYVLDYVKSVTGSDKPDVHSMWSFWSGRRRRKRVFLMLEEEL